MQPTFKKKKTVDIPNVKDLKVCFTYKIALFSRSLILVVVTFWNIIILKTNRQAELDNIETK